MGHNAINMNIKPNREGKEDVGWAITVKIYII